jgi:hypothetical protein
MDDETVIERAARAAADANQEAYDEAPLLYQEIARAVLLAIREPSEGMVRAHNEAEDCFDDHRRQAMVDWQAMIDKALEEG